MNSNNIINIGVSAYNLHNTLSNLNSSITTLSNKTTFSNLSLSGDITMGTYNITGIGLSNYNLNTSLTDLYNKT